MSLTRRGFLTLLGGGGAAAAAGVALPGCAPGDGPAPSVSLAGLDAAGNLSFGLSDFPALDRPGGAVIVHAPGADPVLVVRTDEAGPPAVAALSATCTHQGCPLGWEPPEVVCPCHRSRFAVDGAVLRRPATAPLETFQASVAGDGTVTVVLATFPAVVAGEVTLPFARFPGLLSPGGSVTGRPAGFADPLLVMALAGGGYAAVNARCPHAGCTVGFPAGGGQVVCPCHLSRFSTAGALLQGPATVGLAAYPVTSDAAGVTVTLPA